jgi:hypothetical protein
VVEGPADVGGLRPCGGRLGCGCLCRKAGDTGLVGVSKGSTGSSCALTPRPWGHRQWEG